MGNVCGSSGSHYVYSPPASPRYASGSSSPSHSVGGERLTSVYQLSGSQRELFLSSHDPMQIFRLGSESRVYRTTERKYLQNGRLAGNPNSCARVSLYEKLQKNPNAALIGARPNEAHYYLPEVVRANELDDPSLNVMAGPDAQNTLRGYSKHDHVAVEMRLGDFLEQGGQAYLDVSAAAGDGIDTTALIVTLPEGRTVPAHVIGGRSNE